MTNVLIAVGDIRQAIHTAGKCLLLSVQSIGIDTPETYQLHSRIATLFSNLFTYLTAAKKSSEDSSVDYSEEIAALRSSTALHLGICRYLIQLMAGSRHPEVITILVRMGSLYNESGDFASGLSCLLEAKTRVTDLTQQTLIGQAIAEVLSDIGHFDKAMLEQRQCAKLLEEIFGESDERVAAAKSRAEQYRRAMTEVNVKFAKQAQAMALERAQSEALALSQRQASTRVVVGGGGGVVNAAEVSAAAGVGLGVGDTKKKQHKKKPAGKK